MKIISWWSGGITSAVACKLSIDFFGKNQVRVVMIDTNNEHDDTYRFKKDCENWYEKEIEVISAIGNKYNSIEDVWRKYKSLNVATGAICSTELKRKVRERFAKENHYDHQVFGFEFDNKEIKRARSLKANHKDTKPIFPLLMMGYDKNDCINFVENAGIKIPDAYEMGFQNNNCLNTGCVQGGIGYWKKMQKEYPEKFNHMADMEHELTDLRGEPVTMLKDQSGKAGRKLVFLKKHPDYPDYKCIDDMKGREVKPLKECNGFCGTNDLFAKRNETEEEINFDASVW